AADDRGLRLLGACRAADARPAPAGDLGGLLRQFLGNRKGALDLLAVAGPVALEDHLVVLDLRKAVLCLKKLHQPLGIWELVGMELNRRALRPDVEAADVRAAAHRDRKSTRLNSSHVKSS